MTKFQVVRAMRRVVVAGFAGALAISMAVLPDTSTSVEAAPVQRTLFNHTDTQNPSEYWEPALNQPSNWNSPDNLAGGRVYIKMTVTSKASDKAMWPQLCFWRHSPTQNYKYETCSGRLMDLTSTGTYYIDAGTPANWWKKNGTFSWSSPVSVGRIMLKDPVTRSLFLSSRCGAACYTGEGDVTDHVPVTFTARAIVVAAGSTLNPPSNWRPSCPSAWAGSCTGGPATPPGTFPGSGGTTTGGTTGGTDGTQPLTSTVTVTPGATSLNVSWTAVPDAARYQLRYRAIGDSWTWDEPSTSRTRLITGLDDSTNYEVQVRAYVPGLWRSWVVVVASPTGAGGTTGGTDTTGTAPTTGSDTTGGTDGGTTGEPPASSYEPAVTVVPGVGSLSVSWSSITNGQLYQLRYREGSERPQWDAPSTAQSRDITGLTPGTAYNVEVRGYADGAWRPFTSVIATPTAPGAGTGGTDGDPAPDYLTDVSLSSGNGSLSATWTAVPGARNYQVRYHFDGNRPQWFAPEKTLSKVITGLASGTEYTVQVRAYVGEDWRPWASVTGTPQ